MMDLPHPVSSFPQAMMDLGMEQDLLELAAPDLEMFLRAAGGYSAARTGPRSVGAQVRARFSPPCPRD